MIAVQGYRRDDNFIPKKYSSTGGHLLYKIDKVAYIRFASAYKHFETLEEFLTEIKNAEDKKHE